MPSVKGCIAVFLVEVLGEVVGGGLVGALGLGVELGTRGLIGLGLAREPFVVGGGVAPPVASADQREHQGQGGECAGYQLDGLTVINLNPETPATMATTTSANAPHAQADQDNLAQPDRINRLAGSHIPVVPVSRQGAMDYARIPSLHMGKRRDFRSEAAR